MATTTGLSSILAARKAQMTTMTHTHLVGLRGAADADSDDDEDDVPVPSTKPTGSSAAPPIEMLLGRAENLLRSSNADERKRTIAALEEAQLTNTQLKPLLRSLLLRFSDESERCRDGAVGLFRRWQSQCADASEASGALPLLVPVMVERLGTENKVAEPSEEVRASLVALMRDVLVRCRALLRPYIAEVGAIALGCARDNHPEVIKGVCELIATVSADVLAPLCKEVGGKQVKPFSQKLIEALLPHIKHRHGAVRLQVLCALEGLLLCGAGQSVETLVGWRLKNNVPIAEFYGKGAPRLNYLADLSRDNSVAVRRKFVHVCARWCREMDGEDLYEQETRIMPYLVSSLCDADEETAHSARVEIERLGEEFVQKNLKDYKERMEYGADDERAETASFTLPPPVPLPCRPPLGARERVKQYFRNLIHPICAELEAWTSIERLQSARLLEVLLAYTEGHVTEFTHQLLPALAKAMDPEVKGLPEAIERCAAMVAQYTEPEEYYPLVVGHANSDPLNTLTQRVQFMQLIPHLLRGLKPRSREAALRSLCPLFTDAPLVCSQHTPLRAAVRKALDAALATAAALGEAGDVAGLDALAPELLRAAALHRASAPELQPTVVCLADGLEDVSDADGAMYAAAAADAAAMSAPLDALPSCAARGGAWAAWRNGVRSSIERSVAQEDDYAEIAVKLLDTILDAAKAPPSAAERVPAAANGAGVPRRALAIAECDDFSDDEDDKTTAAGGAGGDYDDYDEDELD